MLKLERFLPGLNHVVCGKPPRSTLTQMQGKLRQLSQSTLSELSSVFSDWIPLQVLHPKQSGAHSRERIYSLNVTFWAFLHQVLSPGTPCREVVRKVQSLCSERKLPLPSSQNTAYCKARSLLPDADLELIHQNVSAKLLQRVTAPQRWKGYDVKVIDGTGITLADTKENQSEFPQPSEQREGCGFPVMQIVACFCLASGALLKWVETGLKSHESRILSKLMGFFSRGDLVLTDRGFSSYANLALLKQRGIEAVMRVHQRRKLDYRKGRKLGTYDRLISWRKPQRPKDWARQDWDALPATLSIRIVRIFIARKGFRTRQYDLVTTLEDAQAYTAEDLAQLYYQRWSVELFFRHIKTTMGMEMLRCKTPGMVRKELRMFVIAYNLIRGLMQKAATLHRTELSRLSFKATVDTLRQFSSVLNATKHLPRSQQRIIEEILQIIASEQVPSRQNRCEPRALKRRPKPFPRLTSHRSVYIVPKSRKNKGKYKSKKIVSAP